MRIDDLDGPRVKPGADILAIDDLRWLGLACDRDATYQSANLEPHRRAIAQLENAGRLYPDQRQRRDLLEDAAGRVALDGAPLDPGLARGQTISPAGPAPVLRFAVPDDPITFHDQHLGPHVFQPRTDLGDFTVRTRAGLPSYQVACVIDDALAGVNFVVRGDDLLASTGRQLLLLDALGMTPPRYLHLPLVVGPDGRKLAKRHGDTRIAAYREAGVPAERIIARLAGWLGIDGGDEATPAELVGRFELANVPREPIVFDEAADPLLCR